MQENVSALSSTPKDLFWQSAWGIIQKDTNSLLAMAHENIPNTLRQQPEGLLALRHQLKNLAHLIVHDAAYQQVFYSSSNLRGEFVKACDISMKDADRAVGYYIGLIEMSKVRANQRLTSEAIERTRELRVARRKPRRKKQEDVAVPSSP